MSSIEISSVAESSNKKTLSKMSRIKGSYIDKKQHWGSTEDELHIGGAVWKIRSLNRNSMKEGSMEEGSIEESSIEEGSIEEGSMEGGSIEGDSMEEGSMGDSRAILRRYEQLRGAEDVMNSRSEV